MTYNIYRPSDHSRRPVTGTQTSAHWRCSRTLSTAAKRTCTSSLHSAQSEMRFATVSASIRPSSTVVRSIGSRRGRRMLWRESHSVTWNRWKLLMKRNTRLFRSASSFTQAPPHSPRSTFMFSQQLAEISVVNVYSKTFRNKLKYE